MTEREFSKIVVNFFNEKLRKSEFQSIKLLEGCDEKALNNYILRDFTLSQRDNGKWEILAGFQEQDIVFYSNRIPREQFLQGMIRVTGTGLRGDVIVPLTVCELKVAPVDTHAILVASQIAGDIKRTFPYCAAYFILNTNIKRSISQETIIRQSKGFDRVFLEWDEGKEVIWQDLNLHFQYLNRLGLLKGRE